MDRPRVISGAAATASENKPTPTMREWDGSENWPDGYADLWRCTGCGAVTASPTTGRPPIRCICKHRSTVTVLTAQATPTPPSDLRRLSAQWRAAVISIRADQQTCLPNYAERLGHRIDVYTRCADELDAVLARGTAHQTGQQNEEK